MGKRRKNLILQSTLLNAVTKTESATASYAFTTLTCIPVYLQKAKKQNSLEFFLFRKECVLTMMPQGVIEYHGANIQLLDLPGIIEGASQGMGRGKQARAAHNEL